MSKERRGIAGAGNWIIDRIYICDFWPGEETLANILSEARGTGGAPYNCLLNIARFGLDEGRGPIPLEAIGLIGDDENGRAIQSDCAAHGIDASSLLVCAEAPTSYTNVMVVKETGKRTFFHNRGANAMFGAEHVPVDKIKARLVHFGYLLLLDRMDAADDEFGTTAARILKQFQDAGIETSIDAVSEDSDRFAQIVKPVLKYTDYAILNEFEAGKTTGHDLKPDGKVDIEAVRASARELLDLGVGKLVCVHMPEGGYVLTADGAEFWQPSLQLPDGYIKGAAGAGDAFCAGMLLGIHERWEIEKSLLLAVCSAAMSLSEPGCTEACTNLTDTLALAEKFPFQPAVM
ncbi:MAG: carbohydrate kinase family protein [Phycisphaerales bacterium]|jgi:sugar/nucleoside kinase (ribokinase family)|nr:carbohydrate kinase family protein [Phycisphaerales bacterium]